ncbi:hypothetical protein ACLOJK_007184 [Asimina triloba]
MAAPKPISVRRGQAAHPAASGSRRRSRADVSLPPPSSSSTAASTPDLNGGEQLPKYPSSSRSGRVSGSVLQGVVARDGELQETVAGGRMTAMANDASGSPSGHPRRR